MYSSHASHHHRVLLFVLLPAALFPACFSPNFLIAKRSATEQEVTTLAVRRTIRALNVEKMKLPAAVRLRVVAPEKTDHAYVRTVLASALADAHVRVAGDEERSVPMLEARVDYIGSDVDGSLVGIPLGVSSLGLPITDISFFRHESQLGRARIGLSLWSPVGWRMRDVPPAEGTCYRSEYTFLSFIGPIISTDLEEDPAGAPPEDAPGNAVANKPE